MASFLRQAGLGFSLLLVLWIMAGLLCLTGCGIAPPLSDLGEDPALSGEPAEPAVHAEPASLIFGAYLQQRSFFLKPVAAAPFDFTIESTSGWLRVEPNAGRLEAQGLDLVAFVDRAQLAVGTHTSALIVRAEGTELHIPVSVEIPPTEIVEEVRTPNILPHVPVNMSPDPGNGKLPAPENGGAQPVLYVWPEVLRLGAEAESGTIYVRNAGGGELTYQASANAHWLTLLNPSGASRGEYRLITAVVDRTGLPPGSHTGVVTVSTGSGDFQVTVQMTVAEQGGLILDPVLAVAPLELSLGESATTATFGVRNAGGGTLEYSLTTNVSWATVLPEFGTSNGEEDLIEVHVGRGNLDPGEYTGLVVVEASNGEAQAVLLHMLVPEPPQRLLITRSVLDFGRNGVQLSFDITNNAPGSVSFEVEAADDWFKVEPAAGEVNGEPRTIWVTTSRCSENLQPGLTESLIYVRAGGGETHTLSLQIDIGAPPSDEEFAAWLAPLPSLPKPHHGFTTGLHLFEPNNPLLYEYTRITHSVGMNLRWFSEREFRRAVEICHAINQTNPEIPAVVAINYSPFHYYLPAGATPMYRGPEYDEELLQCTERLNQARDWMAQLNQLYGSDVRIGAIILDTELWLVQEAGAGRETWNAALTENYNTIYDICKSVFPDVPVHWYHRGLPCCWRLFTLEEQGDTFESILYRNYDLANTRTNFRRIHASAVQYLQDEVNAWLAPGSGYVLMTNGTTEYVCDYDYPLSQSWQLGAEVNDSYYAQFPTIYAPWDAVKSVKFFPGVGRPHTPRFAEHFVAYVKGAHNIPLSP